MKPDHYAVEQLPTYIAMFLGVIGAIGVGSALAAIRQVAKEEEILRDGSNALTATIANEGVHGTSPVQFLNSNGLPSDSHFGDWLMAVWTGWMANHIPNLTELHNISARRERRRFMARVANGTATLLVICGVAGTLFCIHPVLDKFGEGVTTGGKPVAPDGTVQSADRTTEAAHMIQELGQTFWPSLTALLATIVIAAVRGIYLQGASQLASKLDRFAVDSLFLTFRPRMFAEELSAVQVKLGQLIGRMSDRENKFGKLVGDLTQYTQNFSALMPGVIQATESANAAAKLFGDHAVALYTAIENQFGEKSTLIKNLNSVVASAEKSLAAAQQLKTSSDQMKGTLEQTTRHTEAARQRLEQKVDQIPAAMGKSLADATREAIKDTNDALKKTTDSVNNATLAIGAAAVAIDQSGTTAADRVTQSVATIAGAVSAAWSQASNGLLEAATKGTDAAAEKLSKDVETASDHLRGELAPIRAAVVSIPVSNAALQKDVRDTLHQQLEEFRAASGEVLKGFDAKIGNTAQQLTETQKKVAVSVNEVDQIVRRLEGIKASKAWQWMMGLFDRKR